MSGTARARPARAAAAVAAAVLGLLLAAPAATADGPDVTSPDPGTPWFGPGLDWTRDSAADYAGRLGAAPTLYAQRVHYPLDEADRHYLRLFVQQAAAQDAVVVLDLEPQVGLRRLTRADAADLAGELDALHEEHGTEALVRFGPEMNGSWVTWGQQPDAFVAAFRDVADAVHADADHAAMVWSPAYGAGYPFGRAFGAVPRSGPSDRAALDTDGDGVVDDADDPYGPYWPGAGAVDWVGLSLYYYGYWGPRGQRDRFGENDLPRDGEYAARLAEEWGYGTRAARVPFVERFTGARPFLVETGALFDPTGAGRDEAALKQAWWRQVLAARDAPVAAISWLERVRPEAEVGGDVVDWRATHTPALAAALAADLDGAVALRPVEDTGSAAGPGAGPDDAASAAGGDASAAGTLGWSSLGWVGLTLAVAGLTVVTVRRLGSRGR